MIKKIISIILTIVVFVWVGMVAYDYYNVTNEKEPVFCLKNVEETRGDGKVDICVGPGYKVYKPNYTGAKYKAAFQPFWMNEPQ